MQRKCAQAVPAYLKAGDVKSAIDCCVLLNQWDKAVGLAEQHRFPQANRRAALSHPCPFPPILPGPILPVPPPAPPVSSPRRCPVAEPSRGSPVRHHGGTTAVPTGIALRLVVADRPTRGPQIAAHRG